MATAGICTSGAINYITIKNMGGSYDFQPYIGISSSPTGHNAVGVASITNIYTNCNGEYGGKIAAINLINAGCWVHSFRGLRLVEGVDLVRKKSRALVQVLSNL